MYKLSIITINLNNAKGLRKTIESVVNQTYNDFEFIIIDGGSIDGSIEIINEYQEKISYWVSEPDKGIYNAMNKGINKASGEYCLFLNSGDWLVDQSVFNDFIKTNLNYDIIAGNVMIITQNGITKLESPQYEDLNFEFYFSNNLYHQSVFVKRELFIHSGLYNENYKIVSDWEFFLKRIFIDNCTYYHIDREISFFDISGISNQPEMQLLQITEREEVLSITLNPKFYEFLKKIKERNEILESHEADYNQYKNLKHGKFSIVIKTILLIKKMKKILISIC